MCTVLSLCFIPDDLTMDASDGLLIPIHDAVALDVLNCIVFVHLFYQMHACMKLTNGVPKSRDQTGVRAREETNQRATSP